MKPSINPFIRFVVTLPLFSAAVIAFSATSQGASYTWTPTAAATSNWDDANSNWTSGFPNAIGDNANLNIDLTGAQIINLNQPITVGALNLGDTATAFSTTTIAAGAAGSLIMDVASGSASIVKATTANTAIDTIAANIKLNDNLTVSNLATAVTGALALTGVISDGGAAKSLTKTGSGQLTIKSTDVNTFTGGLTVNGGTLLLDLGSLATPTDLINSGNALTLGGGTLSVTGKNAVSAQALGNVTLNSGGSTIKVNANSATNTLNLTLGDWNRNPGGSVNIQLITGSTLTSSPTLSNGIVGPWASFGTGTSTTYATVSSGVLAGLTGLTAATPTDLNDTTGAVNYDLTAAAGTAGAGLSANTIRFKGTTAGVTAPNAGFMVNGLMNSGTALWTIGTGALTIGSSKELVVNTVNNSITISGPIGDNAGGASTLIKDGGSTLTLSATNGYSGGTILNAGNLTFSKAGSLGTGPLTINGGTLQDGTASALTVSSIILNGDFAKPNTAGILNMGTGTVTLNNPIRITTYHGIIFGGSITSSSGYTAFDMKVAAGSGGTCVLTFSSPITMPSSQTIISYGGGGYTYDGAISDGGNAYGMTIGGSTAIAVSLGGDNTFTGPITVNSGNTLNLYGSNAAAWGTVRASSVTVNPGAALNFFDGNANSGGQILPATQLTNNGTVRIGSSPNVGNNRVLTQGTHFSNVLAGSGTYNFGGTSGGHSYTIALNGLNTYTGQTRIGRIDAAGSALQFSSIKNVGGAANALGQPTAGNSAIIFDYNSAIEYTGAGDTTDRVFSFGSGITGAAIKASGTTTSGSPFEVTSNMAPTGASTTLTLAGTGYGKWSGTMNHNGAQLLSLTKSEAGTWNLNAATTVANLNVGNGATGGTLTAGSGVALSVGSSSSNALNVGSGQSGTATGVLDLTNAQSLTAKVGTLAVGYVTNPGSNTPTNTGTLTLGGSNTIQADAVRVGGAASSGSGGNFKSNGTFTLASGANLTLSGTTGTSAALNIGRGDGGSNTGPAVGNMDLSAGSASLTLSSLFIGRQGNSSTASGTLTLSGGAYSNHLEISGAGTVMTVGYSGGGSATTTATATLDKLDNSSAITSTDNSTAIVVANKAGGTVTGTLNLKGGTLTITTTGSAIAGGGGNANLVLGGSSTGVTLKPGAASTAWITSLSSAKIDTGGVTFNTAGYDLTIPQGFGDVTGHAGKLTKDGDGVLTLSGINTYSGNTTIAGGSLVLPDNAGLTFVVTNDGSSKLTGTGAATLAGDFTINTSAVTATSGTWVLVENPGNKTFASSFTVAGTGWSEVSNVWTKVDGLNTWRFNKTNGKLTLNIEPGGFANWASSFSSPALSNSAPDADPDGDGLANALEYVFGTDPRYPNAGGTQADASGNDFVLIFKRDDASETSDLTLLVEISDDLADWTTHASYTVGLDTAGSTDGVTVSENGGDADTIRVTVPKNGNVKMFGRVRAVVGP